MDKKRIEIIITAVLVVILILVSINSISRLRKKISSASSHGGTALITESAPQLAGAPEVSDQQREEKYGETGNLEWIRDPFSDKIYPTKKGEIDLHVTGILWDKDKPAAIISNKIITEGDKIGNYTVIKIKEDRVIVNDGSKNIEIRLGK